MIPFLKSRLDRARDSALARNSGWMFLGYGLKVIVQAGYFVLIARALGPGEYGAFVGVTALISILAPFSGFGMGHLLVKNVARDKKLFPVYWGNSLFTSVISGLMLVVVVLGIARLVLPASIGLPLIFLICLSDLVFVKGSDIGAQAFQAVDQLQFTAKWNVLPNLLRLIGAAIVFLVWGRTTAMTWAWFYLGSTVISSAITVVFTTARLGAPKLALSQIPKDLKEGFYFGAGLSAQTIYNDIDKTMLARLSTLDATGIYAAAYRLIDVSFTPVRAVLNAAYANFFRHGQNGINASVKYGKHLLVKMIGYSVLAFLVLYFAAPVIPYFLGAEYARTVEALRWLSVLPILKTIHYFFADALTGAGYQGFRTVAQTLVAAINVALNLWLMPVYSWRGAAWASIASDGLLIVAIYTAILVVRHQSGPAPNPAAARFTLGEVPDAAE